MQNEIKPKAKAKPRAKAKAKSQEPDTILCKAELKEMADINNQFQTLLNRVDKIPNFKDKMVQQLLKDKKHILKLMIKL